MNKDQNNTKLFSDLEYLGFDNINSIKIYNKEKSEMTQQRTEIKREIDVKSMLFDKETYCPVCNHKFNARSVKTSALRVIKKDSDFLIRYSIINPYFYDVWLCPSCGYASMKKDFQSIKEYQKEEIKKNITTKWRGKDYHDTYDIDIAIERYKLSLLSYCVINAKSSSKAMNCLKLAWMYRLKEDTANEQAFLKQALEGFEEAFYSEDFPIYGMDRYTTMYLIGELNRRLGDNEKAMVWFSKVITTPSVTQKLKDMARDQKDLIKTNAQEVEKEAADAQTKEISTDMNSKKGFFKSLFSK